MLLIQTSEKLAPRPKVILKLFVWYDNVEQEVKYAYGPENLVDFGGGGGNKLLQIDFFSVDKIGTPPEPRFVLAYFTTTKINKIGKWNGYVANMKGPDNFPQKSDFLDTTDRVDFDMPLQDKDSFYIDIIVKDRSNDRLICCDPQVENGTKT